MWPVSSTGHGENGRLFQPNLKLVRGPMPNLAFAVPLLGNVLIRFWMLIFWRNIFGARIRAFPERCAFPFGSKTVAIPEFWHITQREYQETHDDHDRKTDTYFDRRLVPQLDAAQGK
jgi:hypothetical protein